MELEMLFSEFLFDDSSSDEDELQFLNLVRETMEKRRETKKEKQRRKAINRDRVAANERLLRDYFDDDCLYSHKDFKKRNRICKERFISISNDLAARYPVFRLRYDARGRRGFTTYQKVTSALRILAYGNAADANDEYLKMSERTSLESLYLFCEYLIQTYSNVYLRKPTQRDCEKLLEYHEGKHGLPGMLGSIDCTHVKWEMCPVAWKGQFTRGGHEGPSMLLEGVASQDLWLWHAFFGMPGASNDINVLNASPIINNILMGKTPDMPHVVNGTHYEFPYFLADGIYPSHSVFVKTFTYPEDERRKYFAMFQEAARKDVERAFGVIKKKFQIIKRPMRYWDKDKINMICTALVILHNMNIEDKGRAICKYEPGDDLDPPVRFPMGEDEYLNRMVRMQDRSTHFNLREDLATVLWNNRNQD